MNAREEAIVRAHGLTCPEDVEVQALCERVGYGSVMDAAARLWAKKDPMGALYVASECLGCRDLFQEAQKIANREVADPQKDHDQIEVNDQMIDSGIRELGRFIDIDEAILFSLERDCVEAVVRAAIAAQVDQKSR